MRTRRIILYLSYTARISFKSVFNVSSNIHSIGTEPAAAYDDFELSFES